MLQIIVCRTLIAIPTLFMVSVINFLMQKLLPGDPALMLAGEVRIRPRSMRSGAVPSQ